MAAEPGLHAAATETDGSVCTRCGCLNAHGRDVCERCHAALKGNQLAFKHGVRRWQTTGTLPDDLRVSVDEFKQQLIADRGGVDTLTAVEAGYLRRLVDIETILRLLTNDLSARGLFTQKGRVRNTVTKWFEALNTWDRFAQRVGVERKPRSVPTLAEYLASRAAEPDGRLHDSEPSGDEESAS
jgi:hypothetical protein